MILAVCLVGTCIACNQTPKESEKTRVMTLNGTTGFGMAELISREKDGQNYTFQVEKDPEIATKALINGDVDICALPTNVAAKLYNRTKGDVVLLALNTRGVLHLVTGKDAFVSDLSDLAGKTVYCPQSPAYIVRALLEKANIADITLDTSYAQPAALQKAVITGNVEYAILPEPLATIAVSTSVGSEHPLVASLDLTAAWDRYVSPNALVQGCVMVRRAYLEKNPGVIADFLVDYKASVEYIIANPAEGAELVVKAGIFDGNASIAQKAIPGCNFCFITGDEMKTAMSAFLAALPLSEIGDALPLDDFYHIP